MDDDISVPSQPQNKFILLQLLFSTAAAAAAAVATPVPSRSAVRVSSKSPKKKANTWAQQQDIVQLLLQHFIIRKSHRRLLVMTYVSLLPK